MIYYWADSADGVATTTVNGENGTPLEVHILYYNVKYGSFHEALKYRNGLAEVVFRISVVGSIPNPAFTPVGGTLKKIQKAGSQAEFPLLLSFLYFVLFPPISNYFVYPGAYHNITTGKRYSCVTVIVPPLNPTHFISKQQQMQPDMVCFFQKIPPIGTMIFILILLSLSRLTSASIGITLPFSGLHPIPPKTPEPINVELSQAKNVTTFPLLIFGGLTERATLNNTGHSVEVTLAEPLTSTVLTGGLLYKEIYIYRKCRFYWTSSTDGVAGSTVNGKHGTPLEISLLYYNVKYGSFHNALNFRDGLAEILVRVNVFPGPIPNPLFIPFEQYMKKVRKPGNSVELLIAIAFIWYALVPPNAPYTAYPGSYVDESTGKMYYCTTTLVVPAYPFHYISKKQFDDTYGSLLGFDGKPLTNKRKQYPRGRRPLVQTAGALAILTLGGVIPSRE
ncbi:uncharacterized protein LOC135839113 [Planococcus citri]|uniref:uncharacterized protein LOC135839113 n=1 Tax=Planococcus citri TaxID=170843 RepID=UPI0031F8559A